MKRIRVVVQVALAGMALLLVPGCVIIGGSWDNLAEFERAVELQHALQPGSTLGVSTASGFIHITGRETDQARVVATIQARAATVEEAQELAEQVEIRVQQVGERLEVKADLPPLRHRSISVSYDIDVPRQTHIDCSSASGSLTLADLAGNVKAGTASGSVEATQIKGAARLSSASGSVRCENVSGGDVDLDTASGGVSLVGASSVGTCRAHSSSGSVRVRQIQAESVRLDTASGGVTGEDVNCLRLTASSGSGNVSVAFSPSAPGNVVADLGAGSGSVSVVAPQGFAGRLDLSATSGSVHSELPVTVKGDIGRRHLRGSVGDGTGSLTLHTGSGSIHVR